MAGSFKKVFEVVRTTTKNIKSLDLGKGRKLKLGEKARALVVHDPAMARDIDDLYGIKGRKQRLTLDDVMVMEVDDHVVEKGHKYSFGRHPGMPWAQYDEMGRRIPDNEVEEDGNETIQKLEQAESRGRPDRSMGLD